MDFITNKDVRDFFLSDFILADAFTNEKSLHRCASMMWAHQKATVPLKPTDPIKKFSGWTKQGEAHMMLCMVTKIKGKTFQM